MTATQTIRQASSLTFESGAHREVSVVYGDFRLYYDVNGTPFAWVDGNVSINPRYVITATLREEGE